MKLYNKFIFTHPKLLKMKKLIISFVFILYSVYSHAQCGTVFDVSNESCAGSCDGYAVFIPGSGTSPYQVILNGTTYSLNPGDTIFNLCPGNYSYTVTDFSASCSDVGTASVSGAQQLNVTISTMSVTCHGGTDGSAFAAVTGGNSPYSYSWPFPDSLPYAGGLAAGAYNLIVTDANACMVSTFFIVNEPSPIIIAISSTPPGCSGCTDGSAVITASGGSAPYSYSWSNGATTPVIQNLPDGIYTACVTDANGCTTCSSDTLISSGNILVSGVVYFDANQNGVMDPGDVGLSGLNVYLSPASGHALTYQGSYAFAVPAGAYTDSLELPAGWTATTPQIINLNLSAPAFNQNFGVYFPPSLFQYDYLTSSYGLFRCNTAVPLVVNVNSLQYPSHGYVVITADSGIGLSSSSVPPDSVSGTKYYWSYTNTTQATQLVTYFQLGAAGVLVNFSAHLYVLDSLGNTIREDSISTAHNTQCSFDPNDKQVSPEGISSMNYIMPDLPLDFIVRFQNTGNDTAFTVTIKDTIDLNMNLSSFRVTGSYHPVTVNVEGREITFHFDNILLPDSNVDEPGSHGWISYRLLPYPSLPDPTTINNTAYIYFDLNAPVVTNTTITTYSAQMVGIPALSNDQIFTLYPNPMNAFVTIQFNEISTNGYRLELLDLLGKQVRELENIKSKSVVIYKNALQSGIYYVRVTDLSNQSVSTAKLIVE